MTQIKVKVEAPGSCSICGMTPEAMKEEYEIAWIMFAVPDTNVVIFQCPHCGNLQGNPAATENTKKLLQRRAEKKTNKILSPQGSSIISPSDIDWN